ncbi:hypothetical protein ABW19_dt0204539 [Dactylella cylindrospora]|nr:hypothetical protein ABW19_dt0204539 [Dactylella cylindrospora]
MTNLTMSASSSSAAAAPANGPLPVERDTTGTPPGEYFREKSTAHISWVWWSAPYYMTSTSAPGKMNFHDIARYIMKRHVTPPGIDMAIYKRWRDVDRPAALSVASAPLSAGQTNTKVVPASVYPPHWACGKGGAWDAVYPNPQVPPASFFTSGGTKAGPAAQPASIAPVTGANATGGGSQAAKVAVSGAGAASTVPPAQGLSASAAASGTSVFAPAGSAFVGGAVAVPSGAPSLGFAVPPVQPIPAQPLVPVVQSSASSTSVGASLAAAQTVAAWASATVAPALPVAPANQQGFSQPVPPVMMAAAAPSVQSFSNSAQQAAPVVIPGLGMPITAPPANQVQLGNPAGAQQLSQPLVAANWGVPPAPVAGSLPSQPMVWQVSDTQPSMAVHPQLLVPFVVPTAASAADPQSPESAPTVQALMGREYSQGYLLFVHQWLQEHTGRFDQGFEQAAQVQALWARQQGIAVSHHYWSHEYLCLYFPESNQYLELVPEVQMWEDAPRDASGDVIMGRMCEAPWSGCCAIRASYGGYCD